VRQGFWFSPLQDKLGELAGVISNPPYIPSDKLIGLQAEVGKHEPRIALDGGPDGMNDLREICRGSATALRQGGFLALEVICFLS
jgi:release factor glutamine methyltransferase